MGRLVVRGTYSTGFIFEHADGRRYGAVADVSPARAGTLATVLEILVGMGLTPPDFVRLVASLESPSFADLRPLRDWAIPARSRQREAQAMVDRAKTHVGTETTVEHALRAALREAQLPTGVGLVRERVARYDELAA